MKVTLPWVRNKRLQLPEVHVLKEVQLSYPTISDDMIKSFGGALERMLKRGKNDAKKM
jgi:hypothetical protein